MATNPADHVILPDLVSKEPLGPMVRRGDEQWAAIAKYVLMAWIAAEELGAWTLADDGEVLALNKPGDVVYALPGHICPTVALHKEVLVAEGGKIVQRLKRGAVLQPDGSQKISYATFNYPIMAIHHYNG